MGFYGFVVTANEMEYVEKRTVAVWGLNKEVDEDLIKELFIQVGPIVHVDFHIKQIATEIKQREKSDASDKENKAPGNNEKRNPDENREKSLGYNETENRFAFIEFEHEESVPFACEMLNDLLLCKRNISVVPRRKIRSLEKEKEKFRADENGLEKIEKISNKEKQDMWNKLVDQAIHNIKVPKLHTLLNKLIGQNTPRKEDKFINFLMNSYGIIDKELAHCVWQVINNEIHKMVLLNGGVPSGLENEPNIARKAFVLQENLENVPKNVRNNMKRVERKLKSVLKEPKPSVHEDKVVEESDNESLATSPSWVEEARTISESDDQWRLRRKFVLKHIENFPKKKLLSLSQMFSNRYYLGCGYSESLNKLISELGDGLLPKKPLMRLIERPKSSSFAEMRQKITEKKVSEKVDDVFSETQESDSSELQLNMSNKNSDSKKSETVTIRENSANYQKLEAENRAKELLTKGFFSDVEKNSNTRSFQIKGLPTKPKPPSPEDELIRKKEKELLELKAELEKLKGGKVKEKMPTAQERFESSNREVIKAGFVRVKLAEKAVNKREKHIHLETGAVKPIELKKAKEYDLAKVEKIQLAFEKVSITAKEEENSETETLIDEPVGCDLSYSSQNVLQEPIDAKQQKFIDYGKFIIVLKAQIAKYKYSLESDPFHPGLKTFEERDYEKVFDLACEELNTTWKYEMTDMNDSTNRNYHCVVSIGNLIIFRQNFTQVFIHKTYALRSAIDAILQPGSVAIATSDDMFELWINGGEHGPEDAYTEFLRRALNRAAVVFRQSPKKFEVLHMPPRHAKKNKFMEFLHFNKHRYEEEAGRKLKHKELISYADVEWRQLSAQEKEMWKKGGPAKQAQPDHDSTLDPYCTLTKVCRHVNLDLSEEYKTIAKDTSMVMIRMGEQIVWDRTIRIHRTPNERHLAIQDIAYNILKKFMSGTPLEENDGTGFYIRW